MRIVPNIKRRAIMRRVCGCVRVKRLIECTNPMSCNYTLAREHCKSPRGSRGLKIRRPTANWNVSAQTQSTIALMTACHRRPGKSPLCPPPQHHPAQLTKRPY
jgi:hypothetical protein